MADEEEQSAIAEIDAMATRAAELLAGLFMGTSFGYILTVGGDKSSVVSTVSTLPPGQIKPMLERLAAHYDSDDEEDLQLNVAKGKA